MKNKKEFKNNLAKYRTWKNITQQKLAEEINVSVPMLRNIETKHYFPSYIIRKKICDYFNVLPEQMFYEEPQNEEIIGEKAV